MRIPRTPPTLEPALLEREGEDGDDVRYFLTALTANGSGRYIAGELIAIPTSRAPART